MVTEVQKECSYFQNLKDVKSVVLNFQNKAHFWETRLMKEVVTKMTADLEFELIDERTVEVGFVTICNRSKEICEIYFKVEFIGFCSVRRFELKLVKKRGRVLAENQGNHENKSRLVLVSPEFVENSTDTFPSFFKKSRLESKKLPLLISESQTTKSDIINTNSFTVKDNQAIINDNNLGLKIIKYI